MKITFRASDRGGSSREILPCATPTRPACPECAETEPRQAPRVCQAAGGSGWERKTGRSPDDSLGPQNGPVAIYKAGGVSFLEAGLRTHYMTWHF